MENKASIYNDSLYNIKIIFIKVAQVNFMRVNFVGKSISSYHILEADHHQLPFVW